MFIPNNRAWLYRRSANLDVYGKATFGAGLPVPCAVVDLNLMIQKSSVRADSSGSRGRADEEMGDAKVLFPPYITISDGDLVKIEGHTLEATACYPRRDLLGKLDHIEVTFRVSRGDV